jgi:hypothetical protein
MNQHLKWLSHNSADLQPEVESNPTSAPDQTAKSPTTITMAMAPSLTAPTAVASAGLLSNNRIRIVR